MESSTFRFQSKRQVVEDAIFQVFVKADDAEPRVLSGDSRV